MQWDAWPKTRQKGAFKHALIRPVLLCRAQRGADLVWLVCGCAPGLLQLLKCLLCFAWGALPFISHALTPRGRYNEESCVDYRTFLSESQDRRNSRTGIIVQQVREPYQVHNVPQRRNDIVKVGDNQVMQWISRCEDKLHENGMPVTGCIGESWHLSSVDVQQVPFFRQLVGASTRPNA